MLIGSGRAVAALLALLPLAAHAQNRSATAVTIWIDRPFRVPSDTDVRAAPQDAAPAIARLRGGVEIVVVGSTADHAWLQVKMPDGRTAGYVPADAVPEATGAAGGPPAAREATAAAALAPSPATIAGHPIVADTATLVLGHHEVHLFGVLGERGEMADQLQTFISANGGTVTCAPQDAGHYVCLLPGNIDVAMVALLNGAARMTVDAPDLYRDQQTEAQNRKVGIWGTP